MSTENTGQPTTTGSTPTVAEALDAVLRAAPNAIVSALGADGMVELPSVPLHGQTVFEGGSGLELVVPEEQLAVLDAWTRAHVEPEVRIDVHLLGDPDRLSSIHFFDLREDHGVHIAVLEAADPELALRSAGARAAMRRAVGHVKRDSVAVFLEVDDATTALLGWTADELVGRRTVDLVHPDDAERAIDGWMALRAGTAPARTRVRLRHADGRYVWLEVTNDNRLDDPEHAAVLSELVDISEEMAHLEALQDREQALARLAEALPIGICHLRAEGEVVYSNEPLVALLGPVDSREALVRSVVGTDREHVALALSKAVRGRPGDLEVGVLHGRDERRCELTFRPLTSDTGEVDGVIVGAADVTDRSRLRMELEHRATHDALSGCLNRAASVAALERALRTSAQVAVAYIDLDHFKAVNDDLGHAAGDELLRVAAARLRGVTRGQDQLGRIGGDEFIVICPQGHGPFEKAELVTRLTEAINGDVTFAKQRIPLRASVGLAISAPGELDAEAVLGRADAAMYEAKRRGRAQEAGIASVSPLARP